MKKTMSNKNIYIYTQTLFQCFGEKEIAHLPVLVNYSIQKNLKTLLDLYEPIEKTRISIGVKYGHKLDNGEAYKIESDKLEEAQSELNKLFDMEQLVDIKTINLKDLENIQLSNAQMAALLFMIEEE